MGMAGWVNGCLIHIYVRALQCLLTSSDGLHWAPFHCFVHTRASTKLAFFVIPSFNCRVKAIILEKDTSVVVRDYSLCGGHLLFICLFSVVVVIP